MLQNEQWVIKEIKGEIKQLQEGCVDNKCFKELEREIGMRYV